MSGEDNSGLKDYFIKGNVEPIVVDDIYNFVKKINS
jgi:hypothetical protein